MSTTAGVFNETTLRTIRLVADAIMFDDRIKQQYIPKIDIIAAVQSVQTANILPTPARKKDVDVEVIWQNVCNPACEENVTCVIGGDKSSTNAQEYALSWERVINFSEDEADYIDNEFNIETAIAKQLLVADKTLVECFAQYVVANLNTFSGTNVFTGGKGTVAGNITSIAAAFWDWTLFAYFQRVGILNRFTNPIFLSGSNFYEQYFLSDYKRLNADGKAETIFDRMRMYFDLFNIDAVNDPDLYTYLLSQGSLAMASKFYNPTTPERTFEFIRYTMPSRFVPGFTYDVFYNDECTTNDMIQHNFKVKLKADIFNNPEGCEAGNTGVLRFLCA
ncbi:MAG: hypothetical protein NTZ85_01640 [Bacteroidia bacterium]|nr:hypothetical protein [Bacteroidia bacterium]